MKYYAATEDGYIKKSIRDGSMAIFEDRDDAEVVRAKLKCELIEISVIKKETHDRLTEENAKLREIVESLARIKHDAGGSLGADGSFYYRVPESLFKTAKQLLNQLKEQNNDK